MTKSNIDVEQALHMYQQIARIRAFEEKVNALNDVLIYFRLADIIELQSWNIPAYSS